jgi:hypothetical protein
VNEAEVIDVPGDVRKKGADPATGLAVLLEIPEGFEEFALAFFSEGGFADANKVEGLAVPFDELGFVIEGIDVRGATGHEEEDDTLGPGRKDGRLW